MAERKLLDCNSIRSGIVYMKIQEVTPSRAEEAAWFLENYYNETNIPLEINRPKTVSQLVMSYYNEEEQVLLAVDDNDTIIGIAWSLLLQPFFSDDWTVENLLIYVKRDRRGSMAGPRLMKAIRKWGILNKAKMIKIGTISEINTDRTKGFFNKLGYREVGSHFISEV